MKNDATRLLATAIAWIATALIFILGFSKVNVRGEFPTLIWGILGIALVLSPAIATRDIWQPKSDEKLASWLPKNIPWREVGMAVALVFGLFILASLLRGL